MPKAYDWAVPWRGRYRRMRISPRFLKFLAAGSAAAAVNIGTRILFNRFMVYELALVAAYVCGMLTAFVINRIMVFTDARGADAAGQGVRFALVNLVAAAQVWLVSVGLAQLVFPAIGMAWNPELVAHVIGVASPVVSSYFAHKHFSFAQA